MLTLNQIIEDMKNCEQTKGMSVYQHGENVQSYFLDLYNHLKGDKLKYDWKLPNWLIDNKDFILNQINNYDLNKILEYQLYHDCGKPYCLKIDINGKRHFPNHANVSYEIWKSINSDDFIATLIKQDMDVHLLKSDQLEEFCSRSHFMILLITGLAEIHANSKMFGGIDSVSFKIKWKHLDKKGRQILNKIKTYKYEN